MKSNRVTFGKARFTVLTEHLIRIEYSENGEFENGKTQIVQNRTFPETDFKLIEKSDSLEILTDSLHLRYTGGQFTASSLYIDVKFNFSNYANRWRYGQEPDGNLGGTARTLDGINGETWLGQGILSKNGFALLADDSMVLNESDECLEQSKDHTDLYFFAYGRDYRLALQDFYRLTGSTPQLPRFALGNWWSRYYRYSADTYLELMDKFASKEIPLSVAVIDMDWHRVEDVPERFGSGWTGYSWNKNLFPNPKDFLKQLHQRGLKITLNDHPADGIRAFEDIYPKVAERLGLNAELEEAAQFNFDNPDFRSAFFEEVHRSLEDEGVDFWWLDWQQGSISDSGADPLWLLNHYQYQDAQHKLENNILLSRYAGPGSHRYPIGFSGDTVISWESLDFQPYFTSTASNIGYTWWSHDIGGHMGGKKDEELALRWLQYGVFSPINRLHSSNSEFTSKEPWHFNSLIEGIMADFLRLRHALIPYLYTANLQTAGSGLALIEPMYYEYPLLEEAYWRRNQYRFGDQLMVAPITQKMDTALQMSEVEVWFPEGIWYDFFTGQKYEGSAILKVFRELSHIPVFAKAGAIVPLDANPLAKEEVPSHIIWKIFPNGDGEYTLLEDDNETTVTVKDNQLLLVEKVLSQRVHSVEYAGRQIKTDLTGNFTIDLSQFDSQFDWDFQGELFRRLDIAEIEYLQKDIILNNLTSISSFDKQVAYIKGIDNQKLQDSLFELIYSSKQ